MVRRTSFADKHCPIARSLEIVGDWWTLLIVREALFRGPRSFEDLRRSLGIASNILTNRLENLTKHEILERGTGESRALYQLTEKGRALWPVLAALIHWGNRWAGESPLARVLHEPCGHHVRPEEPRCTTCGEPLDVDRLRIQPLLPTHATPGR